MNIAKCYVLISPCRDEAKFMRQTLESVIAQSILPARWVIVDDGSTDETPQILAEYARRYDWITIVACKNRGQRAVGPGVIDAFYAGYDMLNLNEYAYLCKLDLDLHLPPRYFERLMERMEHEPRLGTTSGKPWFIHPRTGEKVPEVCGDEMSVGMTKFYRVDCFQEIGGFVRQVMWDGIDCHRARMFGWIAESVDEEDLRFLHLRPMGSSQKGIWTGRVRSGFGQYFMGTSPLYFLAVTANRLFKHPILYGSVAMLWGYVKSAIQGTPRYDDLEFRRFLWRYQHACLRMGKRRATAKVNAEGDTVWRGRAASDCQSLVPLMGDAHTELIGLGFDPVTMEQAVERCIAWCFSPRTSHTVVTANASHLCAMRRDPELKQACAHGDLVVADGMSVVWASRWAGDGFPERLAGVDLMANLLEAASLHHLSVYLLGARREVVSDLAEVCRKQFPGAVVAGWRDGYFTPADHDDIVEAIRAARPHLLFIGMPSPFKEIWSEHHRERLDVPVIMGVGGSFDVLAGHIRRAPRWLQSLGMEWSWRLLMEPRKLWKRYLTTNCEFLWLAARHAARRRLGQSATSSERK